MLMALTTNDIVLDIANSLKTAKSFLLKIRTKMEVSRE